VARNVLGAGMIDVLRQFLRGASPLLLSWGVACGGVTASSGSDSGSDAVASQHDAGTRLTDSGTSADVGIAHEDVSVPDAGSDACPALPPDADIQCGKPCAFPGYFSPCPPDPGNPIGISCTAEEDGGGPVWICSEG
jgi:hypothetical protein